MTSRNDYVSCCTNRVEKRMSNVAMRVAHGYIKQCVLVFLVFSSTRKQVYSNNVTEITSPKARSLYPPRDTHRFVSSSTPSRGYETICTMATLLKVNRVIANGYPTMRIGDSSERVRQINRGTRRERGRNWFKFRPQKWSETGTSCRSEIARFNCVCELFSPFHFQSVIFFKPDLETDRDVIDGYFSLLTNCNINKMKNGTHHL